MRPIVPLIAAATVLLANANTQACTRVLDPDNIALSGDVSADFKPVAKPPF
jgi:hypothetical protein